MSELCPNIVEVTERFADLFRSTDELFNFIYYIQVPSCRGSKLFTAFSEHLLHRLEIHPEPEKVTTFL